MLSNGTWRRGDYVAIPAEWAAGEGCDVPHSRGANVGSELQSRFRPGKYSTYKPVDLAASAAVQLYSILRMYSKV